MLKVRIIPCLLFKDWGIVKSTQFDEMRVVGDPTTVARVFNQRNADELIFLDILATRENKPINFKVIENIAKECFMPLTIGGGIRSMEDVHKLFRIGADKVCVNTALMTNPNLLREITQTYGSQALVVSIDFKNTKNGYKAFIESGTQPTEMTPWELAKRAEELGAGEILLNSIDFDGTTKGYDLDCIKKVTDEVNISVIAAGGAGSLADFVKAVKVAGADAVCGASIFHYVGESIITAKNYMDEQGIHVRTI